MQIVSSIIINFGLATKTASTIKPKGAAYRHRPSAMQRPPFSLFQHSQFFPFPQSFRQKVSHQKRRKSKDRNSPPLNTHFYQQKEHRQKRHTSKERNIPAPQYSLLSFPHILEKHGIIKKRYTRHDSFLRSSIMPVNDLPRTEVMDASASCFKFHIPPE